jgi:hypothetical protein
MFNLLCIRSDPLPRIHRLLKDPSLSTAEQMDLSSQLEHEELKSRRGKVENNLRKHNLLPVVFELFKALGKSDKMGECGNTSRKSYSQRVSLLGGGEVECTRSEHCSMWRLHAAFLTPGPTYLKADFRLDSGAGQSQRQRAQRTCESQGRRGGLRGSTGQANSTS